MKARPPTLPSFFVSIGMDDEGGGIWKNITVARSNGMDGTTSIGRIDTQSRGCATVCMCAHKNGGEGGW